MIGFWVRRALGAAIAAATMLVLAGTPAAADDQGQAPPFLSWIGLTDSRGLSAWDYEMSINRGGITSPDKLVWSIFVDLSWQGYRAVCAVVLWFLDWVLSFSWVTTVATPLLVVGDAMQAVVNGIGLVPALLTISAVVAVLWMARGRWATGIWELGMALVIASLASGVFAQPVRMVAGPEGLIVQANQAGQQLAAELATGEAAGMSPDELRAQQTGMLVDTFIRQPTQMINFGQVLDGTMCEADYNDVVAAGPYGNDSDIRDRMKDCDEALHEYAENPSAGMALGSVMFFPAGFVVLALGVVLAGSVVAAGCWAMYQAVKSIITLLMGLLPGGGRGSLLLTVTETMISLLIMVFTSIFLGVFLLVIQALFASSDGEVTKTFLIVDIVILVGIVVYWRAKNSIKAMSQRLAGWMAQRPGASATRMPERSPGLSLRPVNSALHAASTLTHHRALRRNRPTTDGPSPADEAVPRYFDGRQQTVLFVNAAGGSGGRGRGPSAHWGARPATGGGPTAGPRPGGPPAALPNVPARQGLPPGPSAVPATPGTEDPGSPSPRLRRAAAVSGQLARAGTQLALAAATGGTSAAAGGAVSATRAAKLASTVRTARRAAVTARLASGAINGAPAPRGPMRQRTQPAPVPGRVRPPRPNAEHDAAAPPVVRGEVVRSTLASPPPRPRSAQRPATTGSEPPRQVAAAAKAPSPPLSTQPRNPSPPVTASSSAITSAPARAGKKPAAQPSVPQAGNGLPAAPRGGKAASRAAAAGRQAGTDRKVAPRGPGPDHPASTSPPTVRQTVTPTESDRPQPETAARLQQRLEDRTRRGRSAQRRPRR